MASSLSIPLDIVETIFDELADAKDRQSLLRCTMVSSAFLFLSRKHLFRYVKLGYVDNWRKHPHCAVIFRLISDKPETIALIRNIRIEGGHWMMNERTCVPLLYRIAKENSLHSLSFHMEDVITWPDLKFTLQETFRCMFLSTNLHTISFTGLITSNFPIELFATSPALKHLAYSQAYSNRGDFENSTAMQFPPSLKLENRRFLESLEICGRHSDRLITYLTHPLCPIKVSYLTDLVVDKWSMEALEVAGEVMKASRNSLESLVSQNRASGHAKQLDLPETIIGLNLPETIIGLKAMEHLQSLKFHLYPSDAQCQWVADIVSIRSLPRSIKKLLLVFDSDASGGYATLKDVENTFRVERSGRHRLDRVLSSICDGEAFPCLKAVEIQVYFGSDESEPLASQQKELHLRRYFPRLEKTGYLTGGLVSVT
ncbi:hypothetical protein D9615_004921 [Tricholomella constricta]|uniref:F-box domain-containing protein n=1 Tax=Tricholomella constricta TaxID=117010 RepID=A0A8H5HH28_9AGAR|nr:hypothetical protein D9615_004921 [Tricholomella constricta]